MNVVVANISKLPKEIRENNYSIKINGCDVSEISAIHTNESIIKTFAELQAIKKTGGIDKVIMLVSNVVLKDANRDLKKTALEYYKEQVKSCCKCGDEIFYPIIRIENDDDSPRANSIILGEICEKINNDDTIYIDSAGGARTISNLIQLLTKILLYKGIKNPLILYSNIQNKPATIEDTSDFTKMTNLADGFNEFMTTGKVDQLKDCLLRNGLDKQNTKLSVLLGLMSEFSDKLRLGDVESLDETILSLQKQLLEIDINDNSSIEAVIINQFIPIIQRNLVGDNFEAVDYLRIIKWCIHNVLIQQALTIFVEKMPVVLFQKDIIHYYGDVRATKLEYKNNKAIIDPYDWETFVFFTEILDNQIDKPEKLVNLMEAINTGKVHSEIKKTYLEISSLKKTWPNIPSKINPKLKNFVETNRYGSYSGFLKDLKNGSRDSFLCDLLNIDNSEVKKKTTIEKKFSAINNIKKGSFNSLNFKTNVSLQSLANVYYGYIYVKNIRNRTNHASSVENFTAEQKNILNKLGYNFEKYDLTTVKNNLWIAVKAVENCFDEIENNKIQKEKLHEEADFEPTKLNVGDVVLANCIAEKVVKIEAHNYNIQLVVNRGIDAMQFVGKSFNVRIKQVSKARKIIQVEIV